MYKIDGLQDLVKDYLGPDRQFVNYSATNLTSPGENYGSLILSVNIKVLNLVKKDHENVKVVAKTPPESEFAQQMFNTSVTFKNEIAFYRTIWPLLKQHQEEHGLAPKNYIAKYAGGRVNLQDEGEVDAKAVLLLENLVVDGYAVENRQLGLDLETTKLVLSDLANLHGTAIAIRLNKPEQFKDKILPYLDGMLFGQTDHHNALLQNGVNAFLKALQEHETLNKFYDKVDGFLNNWHKRTKQTVFSTIVHADLWVNNFMLKKQNDKWVENKFVDFQVCRLQSPADDLLFFLFTSVQDEVLSKNLQYFLQFYYNQLLHTLGQLKCDLSLFTYDAFKQELEDAKQEQFHHSATMIFPIFLDKSKARDPKNFQEDENIFDISERQMQKFELVIECYRKLGWLD